MKWFDIYTSMDTWGPRAAYIRNGLDLDLWMRNFDMFMRNTVFPASFMITYNSLSVTSFIDLLMKMLEWRQTYNYGDPTKTQRIKFDTPHLKEPSIFDILILPKDEFLPFMERCYQFIGDNTVDGDNRKFSRLEHDKFKRVVEHMKNRSLPKETLESARGNFHRWITEHDRRHGKDFLSTFPEMSNFWEICRKAAA